MLVFFFKNNLFLIVCTLVFCLHVYAYLKGLDPLELELQIAVDVGN